VARLLVFWQRPFHLSTDGAETWALGEARSLLALEAVERVELTRLQTASSRYGLDRDWMLEVHLAADADPSACVDDETFALLLRDLRVLRTHPEVALVDASRTVVPETS